MSFTAPLRDHAIGILQRQALAERSSVQWDRFELRSLPEAHGTVEDSAHIAPAHARLDDDPVAALLHDDEELPSYDTINTAGHPSLPEYEEDRLRTPVAIYDFRFISYKAQYLIRQESDRRDSVSSINDGPRTRSYAVLHRTKPSFLSRQADISIYAFENHGLRDTPEATVRKQAESQLLKVATINADKSNTIPWMPRASIDHWTRHDAASATSAYKAPTNYPMSAPNFSDWKIKVGERLLIWALSARPASLLLVDKASQEVVARFIYSDKGTTATKDQDIGSFEFYKIWDRSTEEAADLGPLSRIDSNQMDRRLEELILASGLIVIRHWRSMGRHYRNAQPQGYKPPELSRHSNAFIPPLSRGQSVIQIGTRTNVEIARRNSTTV